MYRCVRLADPDQIYSHEEQIHRVLQQDHRAHPVHDAEWWNEEEKLLDTAASRAQSMADKKWVCENTMRVIGRCLANHAAMFPRNAEELLHYSMNKDWISQCLGTAKVKGVSKSLQAVYYLCVSEIRNMALEQRLNDDPDAD